MLEKQTRLADESFTMAVCEGIIHHTSGHQATSGGLGQGKAGCLAHVTLSSKSSCLLYGSCHLRWLSNFVRGRVILGLNHRTAIGVGGVLIFVHVAMVEYSKQSRNTGSYFNVLLQSSSRWCPPDVLDYNTQEPQQVWSIVRGSVLIASIEAIYCLCLQNNFTHLSPLKRPKAATNCLHGQQ